MENTRSWLNLFIISEKKLSSFYIDLNPQAPKWPQLHHHCGSFISPRTGLVLLKCRCIFASLFAACLLNCSHIFLFTTSILTLPIIWFVADMSSLNAFIGCFVYSVELKSKNWGCLFSEKLKIWFGLTRSHRGRDRCRRLFFFLFSCLYLRCDCGLL